MSAVVFVFFVCLTLASSCLTERVTWIDGKCRIKGNKPKHMLGPDGGYSGYCPPDYFYINSWTPCKNCPGSRTNCCENTFRTCYYDKNVNGSCDWAKNVTTTTATPKKPKTSTTLPKDTTEAPCETGNDNETFYPTEHVITPVTTTNKVHSPTPSPTPSLPTGHDLKDSTTTQEPEEASTCIECWVVGGVIVFVLVLVLIVKYWDGVVRISNEFMHNIRQRSCTPAAGDYTPGRRQPQDPDNNH